MLIQRVTIAALGLMALFATMTVAADGVKHRVVYHVSDEDKIEFTLRNIANHIKGVGGQENAQIVMVVIGTGMHGFSNEKSTDFTKEMVAKLQKQGVEFDACGNTMNKLKYTLADLLPGFVERPEGGVVRVASLQMDGFTYIRP